MSFIDNNNLKIGGHISFSKEILPTILEADKYNMKSFQFFLGNPKSFTRQRIKEKDIVKTYDYAEKNKINIFSHFPYTSSLVGSVASLAWSGDKVQDEKTTKILNELEYELDIISKLTPHNNSVVIHPGSYKNLKDGLDTVAKSINKINFSKGSKLLLENSAGEGTKLPKNFQELEIIFDGIDIKKRNNVGVCLDTAHIWGSGIYDLSKKDGIDNMFHDFDKYVGIEKFNLLHLNDSQVAIGSKKDRHECLGYGNIWKEDNTSLKYLLTLCGEKNIPVILETPNVHNDLNNINIL